MIGVSKELWASGGIGAFYKGIKPAWVRDAAEKSMRLGLYDPIKILVGATADASPLKKFLAGALAGAVGSFTGNPFNVIKLKMMANKDNRGPGEIIKEVWKNQGLLGFYTGFGSSVIRAMIMNATQVGVYDITKQWLIRRFGFEGLLL